MTEGVEIASAVQDARPDEIYNLALESRPSWALKTLQVNGSESRAAEVFGCTFRRIGRAGSTAHLISE